jgi:hypothetical protein
MWLQAPGPPCSWHSPGQPPLPRCGGFDPLFDHAIRTGGTMRKYERVCHAISTAILMMGMAPALGMAGENTCSGQLDGIKASLQSLSNNVNAANSAVHQDFENATSKDYAKAYLDALDKLNASATDASQLVNTTYNLSGHTSPLAEGKINTAINSAKLTMSNATALAQAALNEDNTKLDLAELRCDQNTEDAAMSYALNAMGGDAAGKYKKTKLTACKIVQVLADLQDKKQKLDSIRENGYPLFNLSAKDKKKFAGKERTIQLRADLRLYPVYPDDVQLENGKDIKPKDQPFLLGQIKGIDLSYNSYYKWSDDNWHKLNLYQYIIGDTMGGDNDDYFCYPKLKLTSSVKVATCVKVKDITSDHIKIAVAAKYWYNSDHGMVKIGDKTIPAPFGYLADVSDMKEKKMQDLKSKVADKVLDVLAQHSDAAKKAQDFKNKCSG